MATQDKQGNLHSDKNGQFVSKGKEDVARKYEKYAPTEEPNYKAKSRKEDEKTEVKATDRRTREKQDIMAFVQSVRNGNQTSKKLNIMDVTEKQRAEIEKLLGSKIEADKNTLSVYEIYHVEKRHGKNGSADKSMKMLDDYGGIVDTLYDFDTVDFCRKCDGSIDTTRAALYKGKPAPLIKFCKVIDGKNSYVVEAVVDGKTKELKVMSSYKTKKQDT